MCNFSRGMTIVAIMFALAGCYKGDLTVGSLFPPVNTSYQISASSFDESYQMAYRSMEESNLEIYSSNKEAGKINAVTRTDSTQDSRTITSKPAEFSFFLKKAESDKIIFTVESSSGGQRYIDQFIENYAKYVKFTEIASAEGGPKSREQLLKVTRQDNSMNAQMISEIRTGDPIIRTKKYALSKQEIIEVQIFLEKLGYDPGPIDGEMNTKTMTAIEKFKVENKAILKLL